MRLYKIILYFSLISVQCFASPVIDLYEEKGVSYRRDCKRKDWLGYYNVEEDRIHLRRKEGYYSSRVFNHAALHELCHWSRHRSRLGPLGGSYRTPDCFEEAVCDIVAAVLADEMGLPREYDQEIRDYLEDQLSGYQMNLARWRLIYKEAHRSIEFLTDGEYPKEQLKKYFSEMLKVRRSIVDRLDPATGD